MGNQLEAGLQDAYYQLPLTLQLNSNEVGESGGAQLLLGTYGCNHSRYDCAGLVTPLVRS